MLVVGIIFSVGLLGFIIYIAISPKSSKLHRLSAIGALGLIMFSLLICGIIIFIGPTKEDPDAILLPIFTDSAPAVKKNYRVADIVIMVALLGILSAVIAKALKDQKKAEAQAPRQNKNLVVPDDDDLDHEIISADNEEESFDLTDLDLK